MPRGPVLVLDPGLFVPCAHEGERKKLLELHAGEAGIERIDGEAMGRYPNIQTLWLNGNRLTKLQGLDLSFRLKHLFLQNNAITTLCNGESRRAQRPPYYKVYSPGIGSRLVPPSRLSVYLLVT